MGRFQNVVKKMRGGFPKKAKKYSPKKKDPLNGYNPSGMRLNLEEGVQLPEVVIASMLQRTLQTLLKIRNSRMADSSGQDGTTMDSMINDTKEKLNEAMLKLKPGELENYEEFKKLLKEKRMEEEYIKLAKEKQLLLPEEEKRTAEDNILEDKLSSEITLSNKIIFDTTARLLVISNLMGFNNIKDAETYLLENAPNQERVQALLTGIDKAGMENLLSVRCLDENSKVTDERKNQLQGEIEQIGEDNTKENIASANSEEILLTLEAINTPAAEIVVSGAQEESAKEKQQPSRQAGPKLG